MQAMIAWLAEEHELGRVPNKIACAGQLDYHEMRDYIFKYKAGSSAQALCAVAYTKSLRSPFSSQTFFHS